MRRWFAVLVVSVALTLVVGRWASTVYADWTWYAAMGALPLYRSALMHTVAWRVGAGVAAFGFAFANLYALRRSIVSLVLPRRLGNIEIGEAVSTRMLFGFVLGASIVLAVLLSAPVGDWTSFALARIAEPFREMDPYLDRDLSFVVAQLPFALDVYEWAGRTLVAVSVLTVALYALTPSLRLGRGGFYVSAYCRRHLTTLVAIALVLLAWKCRLDALSITSLGTDAARPFGSYAHHVGGPLLSWLSLLTAAAAFIVFWAGWNGLARTAAFAGLAVTIGGPVVETMLPRLTGRTFSPAELTEQDRPYAATRAAFTRRAFGVDAIGAGIPGGLAATAKDAVDGVSVWDPAAIARSAAPGSQGAAIDLAWQPSSGGLRGLAIVAPRATSAAWSVAPFELTASDERGRALPAIPLDGAGQPLPTWPDLLVYPGASGSVVIADTTGHVPAPPFETLLQRLAHAWNARAPRFVADAPPSPRPRIVFRRDVRERVAALAPFLAVGQTVTPVVRGDSLYWVVELFTTARAYPLSERLMFGGELRPYVHHAATAFVHAGTGRVTLVADSTKDAIMRTWMRRFPWLFTTEGDLAVALATSRPPAVDWASLQATALARTGTDARGGGTRAAVGTDNADADLFSGSPSFFALPAPERRLAWAAPLVDASGSVIGCIVSVGGVGGGTDWVGEASGLRWSDVLDHLQRSADSAGIGRQRRNPRRGRVLTIPLSTGIVFVQSHYEWGTDAAPVLAGVAASFDGVARAGQSLGDALGLPPRARTRGDVSFRASVEALHQRMRDALRRGDWTAFGAAFNALGELLRGPGR